MTSRGCFITLEGVDGAGKSTHVAWIAQALRAAGVQLLCTREPGGTPLGEALRDLLLREPMDARTETLLMFAARNEHWRGLIQPTLQRGQWVLCDRFTDASFAYQGGGRELGAQPIQVLEDWVLGGNRPDCTLLFDIPLVVARERLGRGRAGADRFEQENAAFFERTRAAYLARAGAEPARFRVIDAGRDLDTIRGDLARILQALLQASGFSPAGVMP